MSTQKKRFPGLGDILKNLDYYLAVVSMLFVAVYCFANVVGRFVIGKTSAAMDELNIIVFIWFLYASITYCVRTDKHIRIEFLDMYLSEKAKLMLKIVADGIWLIFSCYLAYAGLQLIIFNTKFVLRTSILEIPVFITYSIIFISFSAMSCSLLWNIICRVRKLRQPLFNDKDN